tara:strand:+ start:943 stop:1326 length:384 start_codon:yes stop_codon:yes gene_type:complete
MEKMGMEAVLAKLGKKLGRKPMLKRKGLTNSEPLRPPGMTVVIGLGKPMSKKGAFAKRDEKGYPMDDESGGDDEEMVTETSPEGLSAKLDALMERLDAIEAKMGMKDEAEDDDEMEDEDESDMEDDD